MNCEEIIQYLSDYIDGELPVEILVEAEKHMSQCANCTVAAKTLKNTIQLYQHTGKARIAPEHRDSIMAAIQEAAKTHSHD